jgi:aspartate kinase
MRRVIKFGGTSLATPALVREGARHVARLVEYGEQIAVVVSAPGNTTSELLSAFYSVAASEDGSGAPGVSGGFAETCAFAALGEEQSVHLMTAALRSFGVSAQPLLPRHADTWPIVADVEDMSPLATAKVNEERPFRLRTQQTISRFSRFVLPGLRVGTVPVISGFFAVDSAERVVALGRGGSDITAFIVATQINADEVVIVTDVQGVLSADPRLADNPRLLEELSIDDLEVISSAGARVLHPRALKYRGDHLRVRLMDYRELERLEDSGTSVLGKSETTLYRNPQELSVLTIVGEHEELTAMLGLVLGWVKHNRMPLTASTTGQRFTCLYLPTQLAEQALGSLHTSLREQFPGFTNLSLRGGIGELRLRGSKFADEPGVLAEVTSILANAKVSIVELVTSLTDISIFVNFSQFDQAELLLRRVVERFAGH